MARSWAEEQGTHYGFHAMANVPRSGLVSLTLCVHTLPWESLLGEDWVPCGPGPSSAAVPVTARKRNIALPTPVGGTPAQPLASVPFVVCLPNLHCHSSVLTPFASLSLTSPSCVHTAPENTGSASSVALPLMAE